MKAPTRSPAERVDSGNPIWVFTPSRTNPADLEFILVQRQQLLKDAVERVRESALTDHKHHLLFVGPRGCGKTHLVTLIYSRLSEERELADRLRIAWLNEDETCTTLIELLLKIHASLEKRHPDEYGVETSNAAYDMKPEAALDYVSKRLLTALGSRTLLVIAENLDAIFDGLGDSGQKQLRAFIQENPRFTIVATAQRLVEDLSNRNSPFFGFFQIEHLKPLNVQEATELLQNIARLRNESKVAEFLSTSRGRSRVSALRHLSGGNHRIYIVLSQFITRDSIDALVGPFMEMVDELTPYYQERIRWLPTQQRKIVEYLCACETTVPVKEIAKRLFATPASISSQLQDLREKGYVEASQRGREALYEITEPLMRICVEVKDNQSHQPLRLLVDFLRVWYEDLELNRRLGNIESATVSRAYLESAIQRNKAEGNLRKKLLIESLRLALPEEMNSTLRDDIIRVCVNSPEAVALAMRSVAEGDDAEALRRLDDAIGEEPDSLSKAVLLLVRAGLHDAFQDHEKEIEDYTTVIGLPGAPVEQVARALLNRGITYGEVGDSQREIEDYTTVIGLPGAPVEHVASALVNRGVTYRQGGNSQLGIGDYTTVIGLPGAPVEQVAKALVNRGITYGEMGDSQREIEDYTTVIGLPGAPVGQVVRALVNRGVTYGQMVDPQRGIEDYTTAIGLPGAPVEQVARALVNRGFSYRKLGDPQREIKDYTTVIGLPGAPVEQVARALVNRGFSYRKLGDPQREIKDYTTVIGLPGAPIGPVAVALLGRAASHSIANETRRAIEDYTALIGLANAPVEFVAMALHGRGLDFLQINQKQDALKDFNTLAHLAGAPAKNVVNAYLEVSKLCFRDGRWKEGFDAVEAGLACGANEQPPYLGQASYMIGVFFSAGLSPGARLDKMAQLFEVFRNHQGLAVLGEGLVSHIGSVFRAGAPFPSSDNLEQWASAWEKAGEGVDDFGLSLRLLRTGVEFVKAGGKDTGILLSLLAPERRILEQALGLGKGPG